MAAVDLAIVLAFVAYAIWSGLRSRRQASRSLEEYFLAGRTLNGWQAGLSMAATQFSADTPLLVTGLIAVGGVFSLWRLWVFALAFLLLGFVLGPSWRRAGVLTDAELTEVRYGGRAAATLRLVKAIYFGTVINCVVLAMVLFAATLIAQPFLLWEKWLPDGVFSTFVSLVRSLGLELTPTLSLEGKRYLFDTRSWSLVSWSAQSAELVWQLSARNLISILAIVSVTTMYSATGGLRSVVRTDILQFALMLGATGIFAWVVVQKAGGFAGIGQTLQQRYASGGPAGMSPEQILAFDPWQAKAVTWPLLLVLAVQWLVHFYADGTGYLAQRTMACRSDADARFAALVFAVTQIILRSLLWLVLGLGLLVVFEPDLRLPLEMLKVEREGSYVRGMVELLPPGALGLMVTAMLAALASTVDTHLNWGAGYWTNDIYKRFVCQKLLHRAPSQRSLVWVARLSNVAILALSLLVMAHLSSIDTAWRLSLMLGAGIGVVLVLRWLWWRINAWAEIAAIVASLASAPLLLFVLPQHLTLTPTQWEATRLLLMAAVSTATALIVSYWVGPEPMTTLKAFVQRVDPPGFWGPVRVELANSSDNATPAALWRGLAAMLLCTLSIFLLLVGIGSWLIDAPAPLFSTPVWAVLLITLGLALTPLWWRIGELPRWWRRGRPR